MPRSISVLMLWRASIGVRIPHAIDTGIKVITRNNVDRCLATTD